MPETREKTRIFTPTLSLFMVAMVLANLGGSMFFPFFAILLRRLGFDVATIGLYFTLSALFPLALQIVGGWISDRIGRLRSIAIGSVAGALSWIGLLAAPRMAHPLAWYLVSNAVGSVTFALVAPSYDAFIAENSSLSNRARVFGLVQSVFMIVGIAGPPLGGLVAERLSYEVLAWISAGLYWAATLIRVSMARSMAGRAGARPGTAAAAGSGSPPAKGPGLREGLRGIFALIFAGGTLTWLLVVDGAFDFSGKLAGDLVPLFLRERGGLGESSIGFLQGASAVATALAMSTLAGIADRRGERVPIAAGATLIALSSFLLAFGRSWPVYGLAFVLMGLGSGAAGPAFQSLVSKVVPENLRGLAYGFLSTSLGLFSFFAPALGALLWKRYFPELPLILGGCLILVAVPLVLATLRAPPPPPEAGVQPSPVESP